MKHDYCKTCTNIYERTTRVLTYTDTHTDIMMNVLLYER